MDLKNSQLQDPAETCRTQILSDEYEDFILSTDEINWENELYSMLCVEPVTDTVAVLHVNRTFLPPVTAQNFSYGAIPRLYGLTDTTSMETTGILKARNQPVLRLDGTGVLIGIIDTGIDYQNPVFLDASGRTRIRRLWDQTIQNGALPEGFDYGTEYTEADINEALASDQPLVVVPSVDEEGHGTFLASIAAGGDFPEEGFTGAASGASLAVVKLKPAKQYLRDYYLIRESAVAFQETDLMMGVRYLLQTAERLSMPLVILLGTGTNMGGHTGDTPLSRILDEVAGRVGIAVTVPAGNEANRSHHYYGQIREPGGSDYVEIRVPREERGITMEFWAQTPEVYGIQLLSPTGESTARVVPRLNLNSVFQFTMERTVVYVDYRLIERGSGSLLIRIRLADPTPGIWTLAVYNEQYINGQFHIWLPMEAFSEEDTVFLRPNPDTTLTDPSSAALPITFGAYNHRQGSIYIHSGRGFTRTGQVKPDLVAPGVSVLGALPGGGFGRKSGTSIAAAHGAGAAALLLEWGILQDNYRAMRTSDMKSLMIRGADRSAGVAYPNRTSGYGGLNLFRIFEVISL